MKAVTLYAYGLELPEDWEDDTAYTFEGAENGVIRSVTFKREPISSSDVDGYLAATRARFESWKAAKVGPTLRFDQPHWPTRGFEVSFQDVEVLALAIVNLGTRSVIVQAKAAPGYRQAFHFLLHSLEPHRPGDVVQPPQHRVYDLRFEAPVELAVPTSFRYGSIDGKRHLSCVVGPKAGDFQTPQWSTQFDVPPEEPLVVVEPWSVTSHRVPRGAAETFVVEQGTAAAVAGPERFFWGEARGHAEGRPALLAAYTDHGASGAREVWSQIVRTLHVED